MTKLAIIGYGKMGKMIEKYAPSHGFEVCSIIDPLFSNHISLANLNGAKIALEFSTPEAAVQNILSLFEAKIDVVSGTTGWYNQLPIIEKSCNDNNTGFFYATNFSIGMNLVFELNKQLAKLIQRIDGYTVSISETHHTKKLDKPSGTAITLAQTILKNHKLLDHWELDPQIVSENTLPVFSNREGDVVGLHTVQYQSNVDIITLKHEALNRNGLAMGALIAAQFLSGKKGVYTMDDLLSL